MGAVNFCIMNKIDQMYYLARGDEEIPNKKIKEFDEKMKDFCKMARLYFSLRSSQYKI